MKFGDAPEWKLIPFPEERFHLFFDKNKAPCWFWRFMQRLCFGFTWERLK